MADLNTMLREQARSGLQAQLSTAVTNGDTETALKVTGELEKLAMATAPKPPPYGDVEIRAELDKQPWFGTDPKKSAKAMELGKSLDPKKFPSAAAFAEAVTKAVDAEFKPPAKEGADTTDGGEGDDTIEGGEGDDTIEGGAQQPPARRKATDAPGEADTGAASRKRVSGPWTKVSDAPADVRAEIKRTADKFAPKTKEGRAAYETKALEAHYAAFQRNKGKK
jgi:hypothetical protein